MSNLVHVYLDDEKAIKEIEFSDEKTYDQYEHIAVPWNMSQEIIDLQHQWGQNPRIKQIKFIMVELDGSYCAKKATYVYYHFKEKSIRSITPRRHEAMDADTELRCSLVIVGGFIEECINGTKSMINFRVNADEDIAVIEEIQTTTGKFDFFSSIVFIKDYEIKEECENTAIEIVYNGNNLIIKRNDDSVIDTKFELFFMNRFDKTLFYDSLSFMFLKEQAVINVPLILDDNYMVISLYRNIMTFVEM